MSRGRCGVLALGLLLLTAGCSEPLPRGSTEPRRVIAIAPSAVELVFALGYGDRVVGVGDYAAWPPQAAALPRLGGLYDPRYETIAGLEPDLAVLLPSEEIVGERLRALGVEVLVVQSETISDVERAFEIIGARFGEAERARRVATEWRQGLERREPLGLEAVLVIDRPAGELGDLLVAGPGTFLDELLTLLGVENALADAPTRYPQIGLEEILHRRPQAIVELRSREPTVEEAAALAADWSAVTKGNGFCHVVIAGDFVLLPGPRIPLLHERLASELSECVG